MLMYGFNTSCGTYRHENGGLDIPMISVYHAGAGIAAGGLQVESKTFNHFQRTIFSILARASSTAM